MSGMGIFIFCNLLVLSAVHATMPSLLQGILNSTEDTGVKFWGMSKDHPIRKELEKDPGVFLGTLNDLDLSKLRRGNIQKASRMPEFFRRNSRSKEGAQCHIHIQETKTYPGECIRMMNEIPACHNDEHIEINHHECS